MNTGSALMPTIHDRADRLAREHRCSRSWVIATVLAAAFGIDGQQPFDEPPANAGLKKGRR